MSIKRYNEFILEKVYLSRTIFKKYELIVDPYSKVGTFKLDLRGGYGQVDMEVQTYGSPEDKQLILRIPSTLQHLPEGSEIFDTVVKDVLHILNKNRLGLEFTLEGIHQDRPPLNEYALIDTNEEMSIEDLERLAQTTKIVNAKVADIGDMDRLVYYTNESRVNELFDPVAVRFNTVVEEDDEFKIEFQHQGDTYFFQARDENKMFPESIRYGWHLGFGKGYGEDKYLPTGKGVPFKIMSIVKQALGIFINKYNPQKMSFIAEGDAKANIYLSFFKDYDISKEESGLDSLTDKIPYLFKIDARYTA